VGVEVSRLTSVVQSMYEGAITVVTMNDRDSKAF